MGDVVFEASPPQSQQPNLPNLKMELGIPSHPLNNEESRSSMLKEEAADNAENEIRDRGLMEHGCPHYRRRCRIRAPCCNEIFGCRHCHNEAKNSINIDQKLRHDIPRHQVKQVVCILCGTEQEVHQFCVSCGVCMGKYFCEVCKLFDDDTSKKQYHCDGCGICRIGGRENFFHCYKCGCCFSILLKNSSHPYVEGAMHHDCPICFEIAATPMPEPYQNRMVRILCNDCGKSAEVQFHVVAQKCPNCKSYNTR